MQNKKIKNKIIFITGGSGFIGSALVRHLVEDNEIVIYDNGRRFSPVLKDVLKHKNLKSVEGDILDSGKLSKSIPEKVDIVIHLAAIAGVSSYYNVPVKTMATNIIGAYNVLDAISKRKPKRFLNFSTSEVYAEDANRKKEDEETTQGRILEKRWTYSLSKLAAEKLSFCYYWERRLPVVSIRPFNIYGPGQVGEGAIRIFIERALENKKIYITGNGKQIRAWCYIDDLVESVFQCLSEKKAVGNTFNIGNDKTKISTLALAKKIIKLTKSKSKIEFMKHIGTDINLRVPNIDLAKDMLAYKPRVGLDEGLLKTIEWQKEELS